MERPRVFPHKVQFEPVTSVPYWDDRCGLRFSTISEFECFWPRFWQNVNSGAFRPRDYILDNLALEDCARHYVSIVQRVAADIGGRLH